MGCTLAWHICVKNGSPVAFAMSCNPMTSLGGTCVGGASVRSPVQLLRLHRRRGNVCIWESFNETRVLIILCYVAALDFRLSFSHYLHPGTQAVVTYFPRTPTSDNTRNQPWPCSQRPTHFCRCIVIFLL